MVCLVAGMAAGAAGLASGPGLVDASPPSPSPFCTAINAITVDDPFHGALDLNVLAAPFLAELQAAARANSTPRRLKPAIRTFEVAFQRALVHAKNPSNPETYGASNGADYAKAATVIWRYYNKECKAYIKLSDDG